MRRAAWFLAIASVVIGCRLPPEREALRPLPESVAFTYEEILQRARSQASAAVEAFYVDNWQDLADAAAALEQTSRFLPKSLQIPSALKARLAGDADALHENAVKLGEAARAHEVERSNSLLQHINLLVRQLRPRDVAPGEPEPKAERPPAESKSPTLPKASPPPPIAPPVSERRDPEPKFPDCPPTK